jgi:hypothetical protein
VTKKTIVPEMDESSWLVQRLEPKHPGILGEMNPFSFGGGLLNGGLSKEAIKLLPFSFDYMGAAEFEWGAVPKSLQVIAKVAEDGLLAGWSLQIPLSKVPAPWSFKVDKPPPSVAGQKGTVYVLAPEAWKDECETRIVGWARRKGPRTKEAVMLADALRPGEYPTRVCGWLELDNNWMFFTNKEMYEATAHIFGVKTGG